ncbi:MAG: acyltransferase [Longicatena sp.]
MERKKYYAIDIAKFMSAFFVICIHTGPLLDISREANFVLVQILSRIAVPLFFIISGFLFFQKIDLHRVWNDYDNIVILKHYLFRLFKIYCIWTILYLPFTYLLWQAGDGITMTSILHYVRDFFLTGSFYHLWFLPALMLSVSLTYFLVAKLNVKKAFWIALLLYIIGMFGNVYPNLVENIPVVNTVFKAYLSLFSTTRNGIFFGPVFVAMGAIFAIRKNYIQNYVIMIAFVISLVLLFVECFLLRNAGLMRDLTSMYSMLVPCVACLFLLLTRIHLQPREVYKSMRVMSLLIYVSHIMFVTVILWIQPTMNSLLVYILVACSSFIFSYFIEKASHKFIILKQLY